MVKSEDKAPYEHELRRVLNVVETDAYRKGWRDGIAAVIEAARVVMERQSRPEQPGGPARRAKRGSVPSLVLRILEERGNATTAELIEHAQVFEGAASSSVRTALRRLLRDGKVQQLDDKWYIAKQTQHNARIDPFEAALDAAEAEAQNRAASTYEGNDDDIPF